MDAIILAGGKGLRMDSDVPKALVEVNRKPILFRQLNKLEGKIDSVMISLGYKAEEIESALIDNYIFNGFENILVSAEKKPLGTAGALKYALTQFKKIKKELSHHVLVFNCDDLTDINIDEMKEIKYNTICLANPILPFGLPHIHGKYIAGFKEKPKMEDWWVSCGWYVLNKNLDIDLPNKGSLEKDVFPKMYTRYYKHYGYWFPLNNLKSVQEFEKTKIKLS
ncbi:MAG: NDP-sugar synthase [Candidatus Nanoarchaeia archaeon]|nr:NDP-sugar synthase [Candidatus Nanoarchaeia archaeon]MDD5588010.1 NDP-sugar synthase [Candidatus Nanoarchaeia archaeon]